MLIRAEQQYELLLFGKDEKMIYLLNMLQLGYYIKT